MNLSNELKNRNEGRCELCQINEAQNSYQVNKGLKNVPENQVALCQTCLDHIENPTQTNDYWKCLENSIWSIEAPVQTLCYRLLHNQKDKKWAQDLISSVVYDDDILQNALAGIEEEIKHLDAFGNLLQEGDTVVLTQSLDVKGTSFTAAKGTVVKRIRLVHDNAGQIEGKVNDQTIVILTKFVKKQN